MLKKKNVTKKLRPQDQTTTTKFCTLTLLKYDTQWSEHEKENLLHITFLYKYCNLF